MVNRLFLIFLLSVSLNATTLKDFSIENNTLKLLFDKPLKKSQIKAFVIPTKQIIKYVFDFQNTKKRRKIKYKHLFYGSIKSIRVSQYKPNIVRVVIDSKVKYKLHYIQNDNSIFNISLPENIKLKNISKKKIKLNSINLFKNINLNDNSIDFSLKNNQLKSSIKSKYLIYLDPGHGGKDSGAYIAGVKEKDIVFQISKRVYKRLKKLGYRVAMTRYKDRFIKLSKRTKKANKANADIFVSIHANAISNKNRVNSVRGLETYFLQKSRTARAKRIAALENKTILKSKDKTTQDVLLNAVFTGPKIELSHKLAVSVQREILNSVRKTYYIKDNGVDGAPFRVLVGAQTPAILIEVGYLSNKKDRKLLQNSAYQENIAKGIVNGIIKYLKYREMELN